MALQIRINLADKRLCRPLSAVRTSKNRKNHSAKGFRWHRYQSGKVRFGKNRQTRQRRTKTLIHQQGKGKTCYGYRAVIQANTGTIYEQATGKTHYDNRTITHTLRANTARSYNQKTGNTYDTLTRPPLTIRQLPKSALPQTHKTQTEAGFPRTSRRTDQSGELPVWSVFARA